MKNLTKLGILIFVFSILIVYNNSLNFQSSFTTPVTRQLAIPPQNITEERITMQNSTVFGLLYYTDGNSINFALSNSSGASAAANYISSRAGVYSNSTNTPNSNIMEMSYNSIYGMFPYQRSNDTAITYYSTLSPVLPPGNYTIIFYNPSNTTVQIIYSVATKPQYQINNTLISTAAYGSIGVLLFFGGIIVILYSIFIKKGEPPANNTTESHKEIAGPAKTKRAIRRKPKRASGG